MSFSGKPCLTVRARSDWAVLNVRELWLYRDLLLTLAGRDVKLRYRQTALGMIWVVLQPLLAAGIFSFVFGKVAHLSSGGVPYFLFSYAGLLAWNAFNNALTRASTCLLQNSQLISKVYFPRLILPLSTLGSTLLDFGVALTVLIGLLMCNHIVPRWQIALLPLWLALTLMLALGAGLVASSLMVRYRDVQYILPVLIPFLLYASPVAYGVASVPMRLRSLFLLNPLAPLLEAFRFSLLGQGQLSGMSLAYAALSAFILCFVGLLTFSAMERGFADVI